MVGHEAVDVNDVLVEKHASDLACDVSEGRLDARVDGISNGLLARVDVRNTSEFCLVDIGHLDLRVLGGRGLLLLLLNGHLVNHGLLGGEAGLGVGLAECGLLHRMGLLLHAVSLVRSATLVGAASGLATTAATLVVVVASVLMIHVVVCTVHGAGRHLLRRMVVVLLNVLGVDPLRHFLLAALFALGEQFLARHPEFNLKGLASEFLRLVESSDSGLRALHVLEENEVLVVGRGAEVTTSAFTELDRHDLTALLELFPQLLLGSVFGDVLDKEVGIEVFLHNLLNRGVRGVFREVVVAFGNVLAHQ